MTPTLPKTPGFSDLAGSMAAIFRAAESARRIAEQTGTRLIVSTASTSAKVPANADKSAR